jgi:hypothetical protein
MDCIRQQRCEARVYAHAHVKQDTVLTLALTHQNIRPPRVELSVQHTQILQHRCAQNKKFFRYRSTHMAKEYTAHTSIHSFIHSFICVHQIQRRGYNRRDIEHVTLSQKLCVFQSEGRTPLAPSKTQRATLANARSNHRHLSQIVQ